MSFDLDAVRACFPALSITDDGRPRIYFDNPAGTQVPQRVVDRVAPLPFSDARKHWRERSRRLLESMSV